MNTEKDARLRDAYSAFSRDHQSLRQELLARVRGEDARAKFGASIAGARVPLSRWIMAAAVGLAATIAVSAGVALLLQPADPTGNASVLSSKIGILKSVCVPGWYDRLQNHDAKGARGATYENH